MRRFGIRSGSDSIAPESTGNFLSLPTRPTERSEASGRACPSRPLRIPLQRRHAPGRGIALAGLASLSLVLQVALGLRMVAADAVDLYVHHGGSARLCLFPDTTIYWGLARTIRSGAPYEYVDWSDIPHFALRTPGYPLFLAVCQSLFGRRTLAVRLVQAALGALSVYLIYRLTRQLAPSNDLAPPGETSSSHCWCAPWSGRRWLRLILIIYIHRCSYCLKRYSCR